jgi:hypothetical protein
MEIYIRLYQMPWGWGFQVHSGKVMTDSIAIGMLLDIK